MSNSDHDQTDPSDPTPRSSSNEQQKTTQGSSDSVVRPPTRTERKRQRDSEILQMYPVSPRQESDREPRLVKSVNRVLFLIAVLLTLRYAVPAVVEETQYAATRGKQRAEYETAGERLQNVSLNSLSQAYQLVFQRVAPSVVHIETRNDSEEVFDSAGSITMGGLRGRAFSQRGQGSGVIVSEDGFLLTNFHVIDGFDQITVKLSDGRRLPAVVVGVDELTDLALLKTGGRNLVAAEWGDSDKLEEGAPVWAVGSPFGFQHSITSGILSAKNRGSAGTPHQNFLQTDAAVNPGNSGGPLVDAKGQVVGINTMIVGHSFQGVSLAIPSNVAKSVYDRLKTDGTVVRGWLGVRLRSVTPELNEMMKYGVDEGAAIVSFHHMTDQPSPAQQAGLRTGDVIVKWDDTRIQSQPELSRAVAETTIGDPVIVEAVRGGKTLQFNVTVGQRPNHWDTLERYREKQRGKNPLEDFLPGQ